VERAAIELFAAKGVDGVSISEIAARAGVSQGALYRHYPSKEDLAGSLFAAAYLHMGAELDAIGAAHAGLRARMGAMIRHFCTLYDHDPALFRFMLIAQHELLPRLGSGQRTPVDVIADAVVTAMSDGEIGPLDADVAAAVIMGIVLQTAVFHIYGRLHGRLSAGAPALARAAIGAIEALAQAKPC